MSIDRKKLADLLSLDDARLDLSRLITKSDGRAKEPIMLDEEDVLKFFTEQNRTRLSPEALRFKRYLDYVDRQLLSTEVGLISRIAARCVGGKDADVLMSLMQRLREIEDITSRYI